MTEKLVKTPGGAILYDEAIIRHIDERLFQPDGWPHAEPVRRALRAAGRGNTAYVGNVPRQFVLRHFIRGGLIGKIVYDRYFWAGADRTRSFAEWRLLAKLTTNGLRVPRPAAARYLRHGPFYTADLITVRIPEVVPLSERIGDRPPDETFWERLGASIQGFHARGVYHADMNAYNLQIDASDRLWMLDFDRGRLRPPGTWQQRTLNRLHRSLLKIKTLDPGLHFRARDWEVLIDGYFKASRSA